MSDDYTQNTQNKEIIGTTFRIYTYLFLHPDRSIGPREVQRALGFQSPSSAIFHLNKLHQKRLVAKNRNGTYHLVHSQKIGPLTDYVNIGAHLIPRIFFYAFMVTIVTGILMLIFIRYGNIETILAIIPSFTAAIALWNETYNIWKRRPKFHNSQ